jgi:hypothetical protein
MEFVVLLSRGGRHVTHRCATQLVGFLEHVAAIIVGLVMMVIGIGLGVTIESPRAS